MQEEADLSTCSCRIRLHGVVYLIHPANLADPTFLGVTLTTGKLCLTSIVQIAWRLYNRISYETINEFYFSQKLNMTDTVYIYNHWTTGWYFTTKKKKKKCRSKTQDGYHHTTYFYLEPYRIMNKRLQIFWFWAYLMKFIPKKKKQKKNASCALDVISTCLFLLCPYHFLLIKA